MPDKQSAYRYLVTLACLVIVVAGMRAARTLLVPFSLAAFFAIILAPVLYWLRNKGVRTPVALLIILGTFTLVGASLLLLVGKSFNDFSDKLPTYQKSLTAHTQPLINQLRGYGIELPDSSTSNFESIDGTRPSTTANEPLPDFSAELSGLQSEATGQAKEVGVLDNQVINRQPSYPRPFDPAWLLGFAGNMLSGVGGIFSNAFVIFITVTFMLLEGARLPEKIDAAFGTSAATMRHVDVIVENVRRYVAIKTATSALTGILIAASLLLLRVDYALLLGLLAFLFNFVPNIGSILAAVPAIALAFPQSGSPTALAVTVAYLAVNCLISYAIEPRFMGQGLGLSTLVVFHSLVFWGWVLSPVGMLLSAPLTMIIKIVLDNYDGTRWIAILLSSKPPARCFR
jgi:predicted PurR-regulated permease PerM